MNNKLNLVGHFNYQCIGECKAIIKCYKDERLEIEQRPTPAIDVCPLCGGRMMSLWNYTKYPFTLEKDISTSLPTDAYYLLTDEDIKMFEDMACGNLHYYNGEELVSVHKRGDK